MAETGTAGRLRREITLVGLVATALCAMVGVGINVIPFMIQRSQPGIGAAVPLAFIVAAIPAALAALCYAVFASAMPRAGGSYVYASRALSPFLGFLASFAQWFGLSMGMGVVAYLVAPMIRDTAIAAGSGDGALALDAGPVRVAIALAAIWTFWIVNVAGVQAYERTVVWMAAAMIAGPVIMTVTGLWHTPEAFEAALTARAVASPPEAPVPAFTAGRFLAAAVTLFSSFIGFDAISQAGGEARDPSRNLPRSILAAIGVVLLYYVVFSAAVYHAVPWEYIYRLSLVQDVAAPRLLAPLMPAWLGVVILLAVTIAILNSIPSVMLANSRLLYAFSADRVFPALFGCVNARYHTPHHAITVTAIAGSLSVAGCHLAGDFFLGVDLLVVSMLVNFLLVAVALVTFPRVNPALHARIRFISSTAAQRLLGWSTALALGALLAIQIAGDLGSAAPWYLRSTTSWLVVMTAGALFFRSYWRGLVRSGIDPKADIFAELPPE